MNRSSGFPLKRAGGLLALAGTAVLGLAVLTSQGVVARGNPDFEGIISAAQPTGFMSSPNAYNISEGPVTVHFDVATTNLTENPQTVALNFSVHHIRTLNGVDISDGQPGQPGITFTGPQGTTQVLMPGSQAFSDTWAPNAGVAIARTYSFDACGYYQVDIWAPFKQGGEGGRNRATLASGFIRVLGCEGQPTPTPTLTPTPTPTATPTPTPTPTATPTPTPSATPTPSPTGGVGGATATPTGGVQGITAGTPGTGAGSGWITIGAALLIAGAGILAVGIRGRRIDI
jgi:hypothetical protein